MIRRIAWEPRALNDFDEILAFLAERSSAGAITVERKLGQTLERLSHHSMGRRSRVSGLYEKPVSGTPYTIAYAVTDEDIIVVRVIHQSRDWREDTWPPE